MTLHLHLFGQKSLYGMPQPSSLLLGRRMNGSGASRRLRRLAILLEILEPRLEHLEILILQCDHILGEIAIRKASTDLIVASLELGPNVSNEPTQILSQIRAVQIGLH